MTGPLEEDLGPTQSVHEMGDSDESDGPLPRWWLWASGLTIVLAAGTWLSGEALHVMRTPMERYLAERTAALDTGEEVTEEGITRLAGDQLALRAGGEAFSRNCVKCHGTNGEGNIGPNLTDDFWIEGGSALDIYRTIVHGRSGKGMPSWGLQLGTGLCKQIAAHLLTIRGTNHPGKPPQGTRWQARR